MIQLLFLGGWLLLSLTAEAGELSARELIERYLEDFSAHKRVDTYFADNAQFIFGGHLLALTSTQGAGDVIADIRQKLAKTGYSRSTVVAHYPIAVIDGYSLHSFLLYRYTADGELLDKVCSTYGMIHNNGQYQIVSWQPSNVSAQGDCRRAIECGRCD